MVTDEELAEKTVEVAFRYMFEPHPEFNVGDVVETTFDEAVLIVKKTDAGEFTPGFLYIMETAEKKQKKVHESAILGLASNVEAISKLDRGKQSLRDLICKGKKDCAWCQLHLKCRYERNNYRVGFYCNQWMISKKLKEMLKL